MRNSAVTTTLYKLTNTALLSWSICVDVQCVMIEHGQVSGKKQIEKVNHHSTQQAFDDMEYRIQNKINHQGYTYEVPDKLPTLPMLASTYNPIKLPTNVLIQAKLDGIRCLGTYQNMYSRRGEPINCLPHIKNTLLSLPPGITLDGELYCHGMSFEDHLSIIKRDLMHLDCHKIKYHVFDLVDTSIPFSKRDKILQSLNIFNSPNVIKVATLSAKLNEVPTLAHKHFSMYEGVIVRDPNLMYEYNTRSAYMQKYKFSITEECQIIDMVASVSGREEGAAIFICQLNGVTFRVRPKMNMYIRQQLFQSKDSYIGWWTRVTFDSLSVKNVPLKPRAEGIVRNIEELQ